MFFTREENVFYLQENLNAEALAAADFSAVVEFPPEVRINAARVRTCDSVGVAALIWLLRSAVAQGVEPRWEALSAPVRTLLELYELNREGLIADAGTTD